MMSNWFKREKDVESDIAKERFARSAANKVLAFQRRWADYMREKSERLPLKSRKAVLLISIIACSLYCSISIYDAVTGGHLKMDLGRIKEVPLIKDDRAEREPKITDREFMGIQRFKVWLDSLSTTQAGRAYADRLLIQRPGLLDSIKAVEEIYRRQHLMPPK